MITIKFDRSDMPDATIINERPAFRALKALANRVFGWGGRIEAITEADGVVTMVTRTRIFGHSDIDTFSGTAAEMQLLLRAAAVYLELKRQYGEELREGTVAKLQAMGCSTVLEFTGLAPVVLGAPLKAGVYLALLGQEAEIHAEVLLQLTPDELEAVAEMVLDGESLDEVMAVLEGENPARS